MLKRFKNFITKKATAAMALTVAAVALVLPNTASAATGGAIDFTGTSVGISVTDMIGTAISFIDNVVPDFILVGLGIIMAVVIIGFLFWIVGRIRKASPGK